MAVNISQKDKTIEHVRERLSQADSTTRTSSGNPILRRLRRTDPQVLNRRLRVQ